jgi:hypothetical protein
MTPERYLSLRKDDATDLRTLRAQQVEILRRSADRSPLGEREQILWLAEELERAPEAVDRDEWAALS